MAFIKLNLWVPEQKGFREVRLAVDKITLFYCPKDREGLSEEISTVLIVLDTEIFAKETVGEVEHLLRNC